MTFANLTNPEVSVDYFQRTLRDGDIIGISWGTTLNAMVSALPPQETRNVHVVQIIGGLGLPEAEVHATDLCRRMAHALSSKLTLLPAPGAGQGVDNRPGHSDASTRRSFA